MTAVVWLAWFGWYLSGLSPSLGGEDSGEFATLAATLGISHPPGYPLYALVGRLFAALPAGSVAFRLNLLSAAASAAACAALYALTAREARARFGLGWRSSVACGVVASLSLGLTQACWYQATISDKYPLNLLGLGTLLAGSVSGWRVPALALLLGASFAHHLQTLYVLPGFVWLAWRVARPSPRAVAVCAVLFVAGVSPKLLYPPVRAAQAPVFMLDRPVTWTADLDYLRAKTYGKKVGMPAQGRLGATLAVLRDQALLGSVTGLAGLVAWTTSAGAVAPVFWLTAATGLALAASLDITGREFYLLPVVWLLAFGTGCLLARGWASASWTPVSRIWVVAMVAAVMAPAGLALRNAPLAGRNRMSLEYDYGRNRLAGLPRGAVFFASGDDVIYPTFYLQLVEEFRTDVVAIPQGFLVWSPSRERIAKAVPEAAGVLASPPWTRTEDVWSRDVAEAALRAGRSCAMTNPSREEVVAGLHREVRDAVYEIYRDRAAMRPGSALWMRTRGWDRDRRALTVRQGWLIGLCGKYQRQYADVLANAGMTAESLPRFRRALAIPELPDREGALNNYALALERAGKPAEALAVWERLMAEGLARPEMLLNAGNLLLGVGRREDARRAFQAALARAGPDGPYASYARRQLGRLGPPP